MKPQILNGIQGKGSCVDWPKKGNRLARLTVTEKRAMIETKHPRLTARRQCKPTGLPGPSCHRETKTETEKNSELMSLIGEE